MRNGRNSFNSNKNTNIRENQSSSYKGYFSNKNHQNKNISLQNLSFKLKNDYFSNKNNEVLADKDNKENAASSESNSDFNGNTNSKVGNKYMRAPQNYNSSKKFDEEFLKNNVLRQESLKLPRENNQK